MHVSRTLDVVDTEVMRLSLPFLRKRSHVVEVVCCDSFIFVLTHNGLCAAFTSEGRRIGLLNVEHDEVVRSLFYNKTNRSIISVSVFNRDKYTSLHCRRSPYYSSIQYPKPLTQTHLPPLSQHISSPLCSRHGRCRWFPVVHNRKLAVARLCRVRRRQLSRPHVRFLPLKLTPFIRISLMRLTGTTLRLKPTASGI
jgi:hypothetical protein